MQSVTSEAVQAIQGISATIATISEITVTIAATIRHTIQDQRAGCDSWLNKSGMGCGVLKKRSNEIHMANIKPPTTTRERMLKFWLKEEPL